MRVPLDLFDRITKILDNGCEMHEERCASISEYFAGEERYCDCQRDQKIIKLALMVSRLLKGGE